MPFTFCHPAIILPLKKLSPRYVSMTGLVVGSMLPDFEYFIRLKLTGTHGHTLPGIFYFDLPLGIILCFVFHNIVRNSFIDSLPQFLYVRFSDFGHFNWNRHFQKNFIVVIISLLVGTASHIFWDAFTHPTGFFVERTEALSDIINIHSLQIPIYKILQHGGTLVGAFGIMLYIWAMPAKRDEKHRANLSYRAIYILIVSILIIIRYIIDYNRGPGEFIATGITACLVSFVITPLVLRYSKKHFLHKTGI